MPRGTPSWAANFDGFLIDFCSQLGLPEPPKSLKFHLFYSSFAFFTHFKIRWNFDPIWGPTWLHFPPQNPPKNLQKSIFKAIDFSTDFRIDFYAVLAPIWGPLGPQVGAILALKIAQEPPKTPSKTHLVARTRPDPQNDSKMEPPTPQNGAPDPSFWKHFWGLVGFWFPNASWNAFWAALGRFSKPRWLQLGAQEGPKLEPKRRIN